jgi:energy-coupling factor transport system substrate-specific component
MESCLSKESFKHHIHGIGPSRRFMIGLHPAEVGQAAFWIIHLVLLCVLMVLIWSTLRRPLGRDMGLFMTYGITAIAGRLLLAGAPNIQPVTILMLLAGAHIGARRGMALAVLTTLVSNMFLGSGLWTIYQASGWAFVALLGGLFSHRLVENGRINMWRLASGGLVLGFAFDWWVSLYIFHGGASFSTYLQYLVTGLSYDLLHALGNVTFALWLAPILNRSPELNLIRTNSHVRSDVAVV